MEKQFKNILNLPTAPSNPNPPKPQADRIRQIQQKLQYISQAKSAHQRESKNNTYLTRITKIQKQSTELFARLDNQVKEHRELLKELNREFQEGASEQELLIRNRVSQIQDLQGKVVNLWKMEMQRVKEGQRKAIALYEERIETIKLTILKQIQKRKLYFASLDQKLSQKLPSLQVLISQKMQSSSENLHALQKQIQIQTELVCKSIKEGQVNQLASFEELMRMMGSVIAQIKQEIAEEKDNRLASKKKLVGLFQSAYTKLHG